LPSWHRRSRGARNPGKHDLYLDAFDPSRLHELYRQDVGHDDIVAARAPLIEHHAKERAAGERFGDFVIRQGFVAPTASGRATPPQRGPRSISRVAGPYG
jgi:sulfite reductase beta subunit-like hemoprotein